MSTSTSWSQEWSKTKYCSGDGVVVDGKLVDNRVHSMFLKNPEKDPSKLDDQLPARFIAVTLDVTRICKRNWDENGYEIQTKEKETKLKRTGYLSTEKVSQESPDERTCTQFQEMCGHPGKALPEGLSNGRYPLLHPSVENRLEFWANAEKHFTKDFEPGSEFRLKTQGNSIIIESILRTDQKTGMLKDFTGNSDLGDAWETNISGAQENDTGDIPGDDLEGVDSDEWD